MISVLAANTSIFHNKDLMLAIIIFNRNLVTENEPRNRLGHGRSLTKPEKFLCYQSILSIQQSNRGSYVQVE